MAKALEGKDVKELLSNIGSGAGGPAVAAPAAGGAAAAAADAPKEEEKKKEEEKEESDDDMVRIYNRYCQSNRSDSPPFDQGFGLFD